MQVNANKCLLIAADCGIIRIKLRTYVPTETARSAENEEDFRQTTADTGYISSYSLEHGYPPSVREIGAEMGLRSPSTVHAHLKKLQEAGYLEPNEHKSRALTPVSGPSMVPRVPILGRVTAGMPILAVEEHIGYVPFEPAAGGGEYYALRIRGDSMIGVGIMDDDLVIIRQDIQARNGDIVIALLEDEATCKTLNITPDGVWLMPENPAYPPINGTGCQILGVVKAVYREY